MTFKNIRIFVLLCILLIVAMDQWVGKIRATDWNHPLRVVIYPINADNSDAAEKYINGLSLKNFMQIETFLQQQAAEFGIKLDDPLYLQLSEPLQSLPPMAPKNGNTLGVMKWSLLLRYWMFKNNNYDGPAAEIKLLALFYDPAKHPVLAHSVGLEKGRIGIVNLFASRKMTAANNVVLLHEMLHTLGATDKYDLVSNQPLYPHGYAQPERRPLYPQNKAEIMGGRIPISASRARIPQSLSQVSIGQATAAEIRWIKL